jgi:integrase
VSDAWNVTLATWSPNRRPETLVKLLRRAAKAAGIDAYRADCMSDADFRHSAATHLGRSSDNLPGVMYLLGHKQPATTETTLDEWWPRSSRVENPLLTSAETSRR